MSPVDERLGVDRAREDYQKALRAWHVAWIERVEWHRRRLSPIRERAQSLIREPVIDERGQLRDTEERAYDRFLRARDVFAGALLSGNT